MIRLFNTLLLLLTCLLTGLPEISYGAETIDREPELKAAYLYNILKFISWPEIDTSKPDQLQLCIINSKLTNNALVELNNKRIENSVIKIRQNVSIDDISDCRVLYFSGKEINYQLNDLTAKGLFLIGESDNFNAHGGTLNFFVENNKLRFEINLMAASKAGIKISSKLLNLANIYDK